MSASDHQQSSAEAKPKVLLLGQIDHAHEEWEALTSLAELVKPASDNRNDFIAECKAGKLDGVAVAYRQLWSTPITGEWDDELVQALPRSLKAVCNCGAGYDALHTDALRNGRILATNVINATADATADTALWLLIGALRNFSTSLFALRRGDWRGKPPSGLGHDPQGKTVGILGMGGVGRNLATKCAAIGMHVQYHNRKQLPVQLEKEAAAGARYCPSLDELFGSSDVLVVSVPLNADTKHLVSREALSKCKRGVVIVNTARGKVVDEAALVDAIESGHVASVGLDVYEDEPEIHQGLLKNEKVLLLPHMGTWTRETQYSMEMWNIGNVRCALEWFCYGKNDQGEKMSVVPELVDLWQDLLKR